MNKPCNERIAVRPLLLLLLAIDDDESVTNTEPLWNERVKYSANRNGEGHTPSTYVGRCCNTRF